MRQNKFIFGITGGSGTGKTTVSKIFEELGAEVIDCDKVSRIVTAVGGECLRELESEFGRGIINKDGTLNRRLLGEIVFSDPVKLKILNAVTHKYIYEYVADLIERSSSAIIGIDGAVIIGSDVEKLCCAMVSVLSDREKRVFRIMERDGISKNMAEDRISSQKIDNFYIEKSDYLIYNNNTLSMLKSEVKEVWIKLNEEKRKRVQAVL